MKNYLNKYFAEGALLLNTLIWGATFVLIKNALKDISPLLFVAIRFILAGLILLPFVKIIFKNADKKTITGGLLLGLLYFLGFSSQTIGLNYTSATKSGFITGTFVIFTPIFQFIIEKKVPKFINLLGISIVILGLIFLSSRGDSFFDIFTEIGTNFNIGDFFTLLCAAFFALYLVYLDVISKNHDYMPLVFMQIAVTGLCGIIFALILSGIGLSSFKFTLTGNILIGILYTSLLATILTTILQTKYQKVVTPTKASIIFSFEPIFAALFAFFVLSEKISNFGILGCAIIFIGLLTTELLDKNKD